MGIVKEERIVNQRLILGDRKRDRARGHKQALKLFPEIGPCIKCGHEKAERHHKDDNPLNNAPDNVEALCRRCHTLEHGKTFKPEVTAMGLAASAAKRRALTHCPHGHEYVGANLYVDPTGRRHCRTCNLAAKHKYRAGGGRG